jgi:hypothetical protein
MFSLFDRYVQFFYCFVIFFIVIFSNCLCWNIIIFF